MPRPREPKVPEAFDTSRLVTADAVRFLVATNPRFQGISDALLAKQLKLSAGYVGMVMSGARPPTRKFLKAVGFEAVTLYQSRARR